MFIPYAGKHNPDEQNLSAQVEPDQQNDQGDQGAVDQGIPGGHTDKPGEDRRRDHQGQGGDQTAQQHGQPRCAEGGGHVQHRQDKEEKDGEQQNIAGPGP